MKKQLKKLVRGLIILARFGYFVLGVLLIFALAYFLGYKFLGYKILVAEPAVRWIDGRLLGNDSPNALTVISWFNQHFPKIPVWYPLQGAGISFVQGYPLLAHFLVVWLHQASNLTLIQAFRLLGFLSIPLTALGIYLFSWLRLKSQTIGLMGAVFYLLMPLSWSWLYDWGFFSYSLSLPFFILTFIFFDFYFASFKGKRSYGRLWLLLTVFCFGVATLIHVSAGMGLAILMALYVFLMSFSRPFLFRLKRGLLALLAVGGAGFAFLLFWTVPFYRYMKLANREGFLSLNPSLGPPISWQGFLSLIKISLDPAYAAYRNISIPILVWGLSILAVIFAFRYSRKTAALGIISWLGIVNTAFLFPFAFLAKIFPPLARFFAIRTLLSSTIVFLPAVAAFALWKSMRLALFFLKKGLRSFFACPLSLILMVFLIIFFRNISSADRFHLNYGPDPLHFDIRDVWHQRADDPCLIGSSASSKPRLCSLEKAREKLNITEFLSRCLQFKGEEALKPELCGTDKPTTAMVEDFVLRCRKHKGEEYFCQAMAGNLSEQLRLENWPEIFISKGGVSMADLVGPKGILRALPANKETRLDISPRVGWIIQGLNFHRHISQLSLYTSQLSLIHGMWGQEQEVFYTQKEAEPKEVSELAKWFGIGGVFLNSNRDPLERYPSDLWEKIGQKGDLRLLRFKKGEGLASLSGKPAVLVIGSFKRGAYSQVFRLGNRGALPYDQFFLVEGRGKVDDYSLKELKKFDLVLLHGYSYKERGRAWARLGKYVKEGGRVFVDTGWQYAVPDWKMREAPPVLPFKALEWTNFGKTKDFRLENIEIGGKTEAEKFAPLIWNDAPWGVSAPVGKLKDWAKTVLAVKGQPLVVAGRYGKGRIVWSGMNLIVHAIDKKNDEEIKFLNNLMAWLAEGKEGRDLPLIVKRSSPDRIEFTFKEGTNKTASLFWREAFYPDWQAKLAVGDQQAERALKIYRGGPGLMLMRLPPFPAGTKLILEYRWPWFIYFARAVSILTLIFLIAFVFEGVFWKGRLTAKIIGWLRIDWQKIFIQPLHDFWEKEDET